MNPSSETEAAFGTIELEAATLEPTPKNTLAPSSNVAESKDAKTEKRTVALYLSRPFLADAFGAQRSIDPTTQRPLDTWNTWQQAAERLTLYMQSAGYNTLVLTSLNDGGAIFPLKRLHSTMRFDSGTYFSDGRSAEIKDLVELLCRHFDRCGLKLVLSLDLNSPLPGLAKWELDPQKNAALYQVGIDGKQWKADTDAVNRRVLYNPCIRKFKQRSLRSFAK